MYEELGAWSRVWFGTLGVDTRYGATRLRAHAGVPLRQADEALPPLVCDDLNGRADKWF